MRVSEWKAKAKVAKQRNPKSLATFRPKSPKVTTPMIRPVNRLDDDGSTMLFALDTVQQLRLWAAANRLLGKSGYFVYGKAVEKDECLAEPDMLTAFGLRPIWHGRV